MSEAVQVCANSPATCAPCRVVEDSGRFRLKNGGRIDHIARKLLYEQFWHVLQIKLIFSPGFTTHVGMGARKSDVPSKSLALFLSFFPSLGRRAEALALATRFLVPVQGQRARSKHPKPPSPCTGSLSCQTFPRSSPRRHDWRSVSLAVCAAAR